MLSKQLSHPPDIYKYAIDLHKLHLRKVSTVVAQLKRNLNLKVFTALMSETGHVMLFMHTHIFMHVN